MGRRGAAVAVFLLMPTSLLHADTVWVEGNLERVAATGDGRFGGCMAELDADLAETGLGCSGRWITFSCSGEYARTEEAARVFESLRAAVVADKSVGMRVTDERKQGDYCHASRIKIQDGPHVDEDSDADGVFDLDDDVPLDASETVDTDDDGIGNNADPDDDNDGVDDADDAFPLDPGHPRQALAGLSTPTPWGLTNVWIDFSHAPEDIDSYCVTFSLDADVPDDVNLYIGSTWSTINKIRFYGGIQTRIHGRERKEDSAPVVKKRRGAIFSRWRERDWGAIEQASGGLVDSSGHEGDFIGVRNYLSWGRGSYELCLRKAAVVEGDPLPEDYEVEDIEFGWGRFVHTWVRMEVTDVASGDMIFVGALAFPGRTISMDRSNVIFVEIFGNPSPFPALDVPQFTVSFENFQADGEDLSYEVVADTSNPGPGDRAGVPKLAYVTYDASRGVIDIEVGKFAAEFGKIRTFHETTTDPLAVRLR